MNGSVVKPPLFEDEGALHIGKGKFLLSMSGEKEERATSTKKKRIIVVIAVVAILITILLTTLLIGHQANEMPYITKLSQLFGSNFEFVTQQLELRQADWEQLSGGVYRLIKPCNLSGVPFTLEITFDKNEKLCGYAYTAEYSANAMKAASDLSKIAIDLHVNAYEKGKTEISDLRNSTLRKQFSDGNPLSLAVSNANAYENVTNDPVASYLNELEAASDWPGRVGEYVVRQAVCYYDIQMEYAPESEMVFIQITDTVEQERDK